MPFLLVQLLVSESGTRWRVAGLDVVWVLVLVVGIYLIIQIAKPPLARLGIVGRVVLSTLVYAFAFDAGQTCIRATPHETLSQMALQFGKMFLGYFLGGATVVACFELWRWRKERKSQLSTPA